MDAGCSALDCRNTSPPFLERFAPLVLTAPLQSDTQIDGYMKASIVSVLLHCAPTNQTTRGVTSNDLP